MIIIQMIGGMGNHMFQYALYRRFIHEGKECHYEGFSTKPWYNGFDLDQIFNIIPNEVGKEEVEKLTRYQEQTWPTFNPSILEVEDTYLCGNWQNIGYFQPILKELHDEFTFKNKLDNKNKEILDEIKNTNSVSIHIRRGDYAKNAHYRNYFFDANWMNYYGQAVGYIAKNAKNKPVKFFVFSDDIEWCKQNIMIPVTYVENTMEEAWKDMKLISNCKHNITTNSTFSWWAAWLNKNPDKIVTTPKKWFLDKNIDSNLITLNSWVKI